MQVKDSFLEGYSDIEKGAYLGAIASIATADHSASPEEIEAIRDLAAAAGLSDTQQKAVERAATELTGDELDRCLDILKNSELKHALVADLIAFAEADGKYSEDEKVNVEKIAQRLGINQQQFSLLDQFVHKTNATAVAPEEATKPGFLDSLGFGDKFRNAGINMNGLTRGLIGIAGPMLLAKLLTGGLQRGGMARRGGPGGFGSSMGRGGSLGSLIGMLSAGRGYRGLGQMRSRIFPF
jgi:uncharacterized tellurite resistance protein B-like protein